MSVSDRLGRLLFIVPYVVHRDGVPLSELAQVLGATTQQIEADLDLLAMVGQPPLTPDHLIDLYVEDEIVYVELDQNLTRPLRLTHEEARALVLGAKLVGNLGGWGDELERVLQRIVEHLNPVDREAVLALSQRILVQGKDTELDGHAAVLRQASQERRIVRAQYYSVSSDRQKNYLLKPLALFTHGGTDYLAAFDSEADDHEKLFRLDRIGAVQLTDTLFSPPEDFDLEKFRTQRLYFGGDSMHAHVRFAPSLDRQVRERFAAHDIVVDTPGQPLEVRVATSSAAWLARWVLSFGSDAEVLSPPPCRAFMADLCRTAAAAYKRPVKASAMASDQYRESPAPHKDQQAAPPL